MPAKRYLVAERPFYTTGIRHYLDAVTTGDDAAHAPRVGDVVDEVDGATDDDGDIVVSFNGRDWNVNRDVLVDVDVVIAALVAVRAGA